MTSTLNSETKTMTTTSTMKPELIGGLATMGCVALLSFGGAAYIWKSSETGGIGLVAFGVILVITIFGLLGAYIEGKLPSDTQTTVSPTPNPDQTTGIPAPTPANDIDTTKPMFHLKNHHMSTASGYAGDYCLDDGNWNGTDGVNKKFLLWKCDDKNLNQQFKIKMAKDKSGVDVSMIESIKAPGFCLDDNKLAGEFKWGACDPDNLDQRYSFINGYITNTSKKFPGTSDNVCLDVQNTNGSDNKTAKFAQCHTDKTTAFGQVFDVTY